MKKVTFILSIILSASTFAQMPTQIPSSSQDDKVTSVISIENTQMALIVFVILFVTVFFLQIRWLYNFKKAGTKLLDAGNELNNKNVFDAGKLVVSTISQILIFIFLMLIILGLSFLLVYFL